MIELSEEQKKISEEILKFRKNSQVIVGFAGTGKSLIVSHLKKQLPYAAVCAPTGKAADVLRKKGVEGASTIHSLIYKPVVDKNGKIKTDKKGSLRFSLNNDIGCDQILIDEGSMISKDLYRDLCSFKIPLVFFGDNGQLEPIGENAGIMQNPDFSLETIHRNAGEIAYFAEHIRKGNDPFTFETKGKVFFVDKANAAKYFDKVDQIICAYNKTRVKVNKIVRENRGIDSTLPIVGDRVMCLRNNREIGLFNGQQGIVEKLSGKNRIVFSTDDFVVDTFYEPKQFYSEKTEINLDKESPDPFDYAYCVTCHRYQGSEANTVMVLEQKCKNWDHVRWAYTAASRARETVLWVGSYF